MFDRKSCRLVQGGPAHLFGDISPRSAIMVIRTAVPHEFECGSLNAVARRAGFGASYPLPLASAKGRSAGPTADAQSGRRNRSSYPVADLPHA